MAGRSSDSALAAIEARLPDRWILNSISITESDGYAVLLCPRGPVPIEDLGRIYGFGPTVCEALYDALSRLDQFLASRPRRDLGETRPSTNLDSCRHRTNVLNSSDGIPASGANDCDPRLPPRREARPMGKNQWVVPHGDKWAQRGEGNSRVTRTFETQRDAIAAARETARRNHSEMVIQGEDRKIRERNSYGKDPNPPKG